MAIRDRIQELEDCPHPLAVKSLKYDAALGIFGLVEDTAVWSLDNQDHFEPPAAIAPIQKEIDYVVEGKNKAYMECLVSNILVCCIAEEKRAIQNGSLHKNEIIGHYVEPARLSLRFETELSCPVKYKYEDHMLSGVPDYVLWYNTKASMSTNLVVVEAKGGEPAFGEAGSQVVAYMGN
ncbi:hypothetical protein AJ79_06545 [Helicocarpus griseus UAMH5409]|uniref:Uncharacterized protein n=1 Tax=Helicocarpus griseus UAMH5409 TaxID=1447875 RepID=A0A2B7XBV2_9EURO|nr:hypothetical protein AJ79_06545 [Helicocarpus griseus UAMH5409]